MTSRKNAVAVLAAVLFTGCLLGALGFWLWETRAGNGTGMNTRYDGHDYSYRIFDRLQLTSDQEKKLGEILDDSRREINDCRMEMQERMDEIRDDTNARIAAVLDETQRSTFESLIKQAESQREGGRHGRGRRSNGH